VAELTTPHELPSLVAAKTKPLTLTDKEAAELRKELDAFIAAGRSLDRKLGLLAKPSEERVP
jgi:hypothetical protein